MNKYDQVSLDIAQLWALQSQIKDTWREQAFSDDVLPLPKRVLIWGQRYVTAALYKSGLLRRLIYANLKLRWFFEFREYWIKELGLRRLELSDFYFLSGIYRQRFQAISIPDSADSQQFLAAWQHPAAIYLLFHYQYKLALHPLCAYTLAKYIPRGATICEYGCGLAPITQSLTTYYPAKKFNITAIDIPSYMLHFVRWKFRTTSFVRVAALDPANDAPLTSRYDVIACMTVLEHLPHPLTLVKHLHAQLTPNGIFMFDFVKSDGTGLDTQAALTQRLDVLNFIREHFTILHGAIPNDDSSVKAVICRKK